jgi:hypothetical protein
LTVKANKRGSGLVSRGAKPLWINYPPKFSGDIYPGYPGYNSQIIHKYTTIIPPSRSPPMALQRPVSTRSPTPAVDISITRERNPLEHVTQTNAPVRRSRWVPLPSSCDGQVRRRPMVRRGPALPTLGIPISTARVLYRVLWPYSTCLRGHVIPDVGGTVCGQPTRRGISARALCTPRESIVPPPPILQLNACQSCSEWIPAEDSALYFQVPADGCDPLLPV